MADETICLLNDSFPPLIDGVANTVCNYALHIQKAGLEPIVITPSHPKAEDSAFPYKVVRYKSVNFSKRDGYMAGVPFSPEAARQISEKNVSVLHSHCPIMSTVLARAMRQISGAPIILTYHTKFDVDIANVIKNPMLQSASIKALVSNIEACDEVWTVSRGAGENLRSLGYEGDYLVMPNGVDLPHGTISTHKINAATAGLDLPEGVPVFLFVGRMMWYKGIRLILDALAKLHRDHVDFRLMMIGGGDELPEIQNYAEESGLGAKCIFTGPIFDREVLRAHYQRADLFLFPSTYDTNGLVVREAAAGDLASVLIRSSCASEGVTDGVNGFLVDENADSLYQTLSRLAKNLDLCREVGIGAGRDLYISWEESVKMAMQRYEVVVENNKRGLYRRQTKLVEGFLKANGELMEALAKISKFKNSWR